MENQTLLNALQSLIAETPVVSHKITEPCGHCYTCSERDYEFCHRYKEGILLEWVEDMTQFSEEQLIEKAGLPDHEGEIFFPTSAGSSIVSMEELSQRVKSLDIEVRKEIVHALQNKEKFDFWMVRFIKEDLTNS